VEVDGHSGLVARRHLICAGESCKSVVKLTFAKGARP
jgi:hypothetical protein